MTKWLLIFGLFSVACTKTKSVDKKIKPVPQFVFFDNDTTNKQYLASRKRLNLAMRNQIRNASSLKPHCESGNFSACRDYISKMGRPTPGETKKQKEARETIVFDMRWKLCKQGHYELCRSAGQSLFQNSGGLQSRHPEYFKFIKNHCDTGKWQGCELLFFYAANIIRDEKIIESAARKGCEIGRIPMCTKLANRVAKSDEKEFARLVDKICEKDLEQCGALISYKPDFNYPKAIIKKLTDQCRLNVRVCEWVARYAIRKGDDTLTHTVLKIRCDKQLSRCIELGIFETQMNYPNSKVPFNKVCKDQLNSKRRKFEHRFEKFADEFCKEGKITGNAKLWITYNPNKK